MNIERAAGLEVVAHGNMSRSAAGSLIRQAGGLGTPPAGMLTVSG